MGVRVSIKRNDYKLKQAMKKYVDASMNKALNLIQSDAVMNAPSNLGQLKASIFTDIETMEDKLIGIVYSDLEHAWYVEFGTGPIGAANHTGVSPDVPVAYKMQGWLIPGDKISEADALKYKFKRVEFKDGRVFWATNGQPAQPFLYPAYVNNEKNIENLFEEAIQKSIKEAKL